MLNFLNLNYLKKKNKKNNHHNFFYDNPIEFIDFMKVIKVSSISKIQLTEGNNNIYYSLIQIQINFKSY